MPMPHRLPAASVPPIQRQSVPQIFNEGEAWYLLGLFRKTEIYQHVSIFSGITNEQCGSDGALNSKKFADGFDCLPTRLFVEICHSGNAQLVKHGCRMIQHGSWCRHVIGWK